MTSTRAIIAAVARGMKSAEENDDNWPEHVESALRDIDVATDVDAKLSNHPRYIVTLPGILDSDDEACHVWYSDSSGYYLGDSDSMRVES